MAILYKQESNNTSTPKLERPQGELQWNPEIRAKLIDLRNLIKWEKDAEKKKELQRQVARLERFDRLQEWVDIKDEKTKDAIRKVLKGKSSETYSNSDLLTLRKKGMDIASLTLVQKDNPETIVLSSAMKTGDIFTVNFGSNPQLRDRTGAGDILPPTIKTVKINGVEATRKNAPRPGYYDAIGRYRPIYDGYTIEVMSLWESTADDDAANERQWKRERLEDMILNEDKPLTDIADDIGLEKDIKEYKNRAENLSRKFRRGIDTVKASAFRLDNAEFQRIANMVGLPQEKIERVKVIMGSIGEHESNSNYQAVGQILPSGSHKGTAAMWRYQIMPKNWVSWSNIHFGGELEPSPENQDKVAFAQMSRYYMKYVNQFGNNEEAIFREIAGDWYWRGSAQIAWHPNTGWYQGSVLAIYRSLDNATKTA